MWTWQTVYVLSDIQLCFSRKTPTLILPHILVNCKWTKMKFESVVGFELLIITVRMNALLRTELYDMFSSPHRYCNAITWRQWNLLLLKNESELYSSTEWRGRRAVEIVMCLKCPYFFVKLAQVLCTITKYDHCHRTCVTSESRHQYYRVPINKLNNFCTARIRIYSAMLTEIIVHIRFFF